MYPASYSLDNIVSVAAMSEKNHLAPFSNYGAKAVHLAAPGTNIFSTCVINNENMTFYENMASYINVIGSGNSCYACGIGTSFAAPFVTGTLALLKAQFPEESYQSLIARLLAGVDKLPELEGKVKTGGKLNIYNALTGSKPILPIPPSGKNGESFRSWYESNW